ncbi:phosphoethanolamine transferase [Klebsiella grimontii]|uniref:Phosphoethanolamine transferase n=1 Tax=Klebsiella grimontii TaxID=2058152 RepID=A0A7H4NUU9_9ENTR|nr:phosphoethanolamine transferase [Klebsiella grimontii]
MKYIKTMTQLKLSIWLALYIGWFMNAAVFFRRFEGYAQEFTIWKGLSGAVELIGTFLVTFFLLRILSLFGRRGLAHPRDHRRTILRRRQLLHDLPERGDRLRDYCLGDDH